MLRSFVIAVGAAIGLFAGPPGAASGIELNRVGSFETPTYVTGAPRDNDRLFVVEQSGTVRVLVDGEERNKPFLDLTDKVLAGGERGLLSIAFAPNYDESGRLYAYYTRGDGDIVIAELKRRRGTENRVDGDYRRNVLRVEHSRFSNHNGGQLQFGPDGELYAGLGDGGGGDDQLGNGQSLGTLLGKVIRIDPRKSDGEPYSVPRSNPFVGAPGQNEIYSYGLRNPFRFSFDRATGDLTIGDVGQQRREEVDFERRGAGKGANYGWGCFEGSLPNNPCDAPGHRGPVLERDHEADDVCSITGGYVIRDERLPSLVGRYVYGDFCDPELRSVVLSPGGATGDAPLGLSVESMSSFGEDANGRVYAASLNGPVYRLDP